MNILSTVTLRKVYKGSLMYLGRPYSPLNSKSSLLEKGKDLGQKVVKVHLPVVEP